MTGQDVPSEGQLTFDAEGIENEESMYHSRRFHVPGEASGLTIGRGYDMKLRSKADIRDDLINAGLAMEQASLISQAAGMAGDRAEEFVAENELEDFQISREQQVALFGIEYARQQADTRRLATKDDVTRAYGQTDWDALDDTIRDVLVDLRFRGDYTPSCRRFLQRHVAANDLTAFAVEISNRERWPNVPTDRFNRRRERCDRTIG